MRTNSLFNMRSTCQVHVSVFINLLSQCWFWRLLHITFLTHAVYNNLCCSSNLISRIAPCLVCSDLIPFSICGKQPTGNIPTMCFQCKSIFCLNCTARCAPLCLPSVVFCSIKFILETNAQSRVYTRGCTNECRHTYGRSKARSLNSSRMRSLKVGALKFRSNLEFAQPAWKILTPTECLENAT